ncbi:MAG: hypothetical protein ABJA67_16435 [Chthonomonadales bacterium]
MDQLEREKFLVRANLLCLRGKYEEATIILNGILVYFPNDDEIQELVVKIRKTKYTEKAHLIQKYALRRKLLMATSSQRLSWWCGLFVGFVWSIYWLVQSILIGVRNGFRTNTEYLLESEYSNRFFYMPVFVNVLFFTVVILATLLAASILIILTRSSAQWEEIEGGSEPPFNPLVHF